MTTTQPSSLVEGPCNLQFAGYITLTPIGGGKDELQDLTNRLVDRVTASAIEVSTETSTIMANSTNNNRANVSMIGQKLEKVTRFLYLGATVCKNGIC